MKGGSRCGAGRPAQHAKAEQCRHIDIRRFVKADILRPGAWGWVWNDPDTGKEAASIGINVKTMAMLTLDYAVGGVPICEPVRIERTPCTFGHSRPWFACPACGHRVALLYLRGVRFRCRNCHGLRYASQSEDVCGRSWRKQSKLEDRLGQHWSKPKGMHKATHARILGAIWQCEGEREDALVAYIDRIDCNGQ